MRKMLWRTLLLVFPFTAAAQADRTSWSILSSLQAGQTIQVVDVSSKKHTGTFIRVSDTAIAYRTDRGEGSIQRQEVRTVKLMRPSHLLRNTLIGVGIGGGAGAGLSAAAWESHGFLGGKGAGAAVGASIGCLVGGALGASIHRAHSTLIYSSH